MSIAVSVAGVVAVLLIDAFSRIDSMMERRRAKEAA
jgi:hypothetical protein